MAVPPNLVGFVEKAGLRPVESYGVDSQQQMDAEIFRKYWKVQNPLVALREVRDYITQGWAEMNATLRSLTEDSDLILTGTTYQEVAANVAEYRDVPLAALHYFPARANSHVLPLPLPSAVVRQGWAVMEWVHWRALKDAEDAQRRDLGLPQATVRAVRRIVEGGTLEIQAYDELFFPGLADEWGGTRPFVGAMTLGLGSAQDDEVASWITAGRAPIYFGFGSMPVASPADAVAMITAACAEIGERALISAGAWDLDGIRPAEHVKIVRSVNHAEVFPLCRAVVHHGGAGTTAAGIRAGVPSVILWVGADQPFWAKQVERLKVGVYGRFSKTTTESLTQALRTVLEPNWADRAREVATWLTKPAESARATADLLEETARRGR